jgi:hypothetical protein
MQLLRSRLMGKLHSLRSSLPTRKKLWEIKIMSKKEAHALKIHRGFIGVSYTALCVGKRVYQEKLARL